MRATLDYIDDGATILVRVWLDERRKVTKDDPRLDTPEFPYGVGDPSPDWVVEYRYGAEPPEIPAAEEFHWLRDEEGKIAHEDGGFAIVDGKAEHHDTPPMQQQSQEDYEAALLAEAAVNARAALAERTAVPSEAKLADLSEGVKL